MNRLFLLVTNFVNANFDYANFYNTLKSFGPWCHYLDTGWVIRTQRDLTDMVVALHPLTGPGDHFMMVDISNMNRNGWMPAAAWQWMNDNEADSATGTAVSGTTNPNARRSS